MSLANLYQSKAEFIESVNAGMDIITGPLLPPYPQDKKDLKSLLAILITGTIDLTAEAINDPELDKKLMTVRAAILAAYNLGKKSACQQN